MGVHIQGINGQIIRRQVETLEHFLQGQLVSVSENDDFLEGESLREHGIPLVRRDKTDLRGLLHFTLDESQQMLLIHAGRVVDVGVDFSNVVKVPVKRSSNKSGNGHRTGFTYEEQPIQQRQSD